MSSHLIKSHLMCFFKTIFNPNFLPYSACSLFSFPYHLSCFILLLTLLCLLFSSSYKLICLIVPLISKKKSSYFFPLFFNLLHLFIFFFQVLSLSSFGCLCRPMRMSGNKLLGLWEMLQVKEYLFLCQQLYLSIAASVFYFLYTDSD